jgi:hypothetical protein
MFTIPFTQYQDFCRLWNKSPDMRHNLRFGQAFYNYADLHKMTQTPFLDKLYNASFMDAEKMILDILDYAN